MEEDQESCGGMYINTLFDVNRAGFNHVAEIILTYLDYTSFFQFKRSSKIVYDFINKSNLEQVKLRQKLSSDWKNGVGKAYTLQTPGLVSAAKLFDNGQKIVCGVDQQIQVCNIRTGQCDLLIRSYNDVVTCIELAQIDDKDYIISGSQDGVLAVWSLCDNGACVSQKQLFGRIEVVKCKENYLVTAHFGIAYDIGCISVRNVLSASNMPVVFSIYQELFPIFCMDFTSNHLAALEWSGTYNNVHAGTVLLYRWMEPQPLANLAHFVDCYAFTCCRFVDESILITGGHDKLIRLWNVTPCDNVVTCLRTLGGHTNVIVRLELTQDRAVSRDLDGHILVWDLQKSTLDGASVDLAEDFEAYLVRRVTSNSKTVTCIALDNRQLVMGSIGHVCVFDYWNAPSVI